ncbi:MAG: tRNA adenosine(34) deaminase TadA [Sumerlaeia bacterium]
MVYHPEREQDVYWMSRALGYARIAVQQGEVPIGCVIVLNGKEIGGSHDTKELTKDPTGHAEINALRQASRYMGDWRLEDCELYVTLEPCPMCMGSMIQGRIRRLIYGATNRRWTLGEQNDLLLQNPTLNHQLEVTRHVLQEECSTLLKQTFKQYRIQKSNKS